MTEVDPTSGLMTKSEENMADAIRKQVELGGREAQVAASIARDYVMVNYFQKGSSLTGLNFYGRCCLDVFGVLYPSHS